MNNHSQNRVGYKKTPVGWIPEEWEICKLEGISENFKSGEGITSSEITPLGDYPVYGGNGLRGYTDKYNHNGNFILIGRQGALCGNILVVTGKNYISEHAIAVSVNKRSDYLWLGYYLEFMNLNRLSESSAQPGLAVNKLLKLKIPIPPISEQNKIAVILNTVDETLNKIQLLITQLQLRNKGLLQLLLSGKKRLKEFKKNEVHFLPIHFFAKEVSEKNKTDKELIVLSCTKYDGLVPSLEYFGRKIYNDDLTTYKIVSKNSFAYATNHIEEGSIGYQASYDQALISPMYTVFKTDVSVDDEYIYKVLKSHYYIHEYKKRMEGSIDRRGGLRWDEFSKIKVLMPSLEEQRAIADILNKGDEEVKLQQQRLTALQLQKKGLMQKLLTGEVRVKIA